MNQVHGHQNKRQTVERKCTIKPNKTYPANKQTIIQRMQSNTQPRKILHRDSKRQIKCTLSIDFLLLNIIDWRLSASTVHSGVN